MKKKFIDYINKYKYFITLILLFLFSCLSITSLIISITIKKDFHNLNLTEQIEKRIQYVVEIKAFNEEEHATYGTGFFVTSKGDILTNKHVVSVFENSNWRPYTSIYVRFANKNEYIEASLKKVSENSDIALLSIASSENYEYPDLTNEKLFYGEEIYSLSNSMNLGISYTSGKVSQPSVNLIDSGVTRKFMQLDLAISEGSSGSPVFNKFGNVIGMITLRKRDSSGTVIYGYAFAIPSDLLIDFLSKNIYN